VILSLLYSVQRFVEAVVLVVSRLFRFDFRMLGFWFRGVFEVEAFEIFFDEYETSETYQDDK